MPRGLTPRERQNERYWTQFCDYLNQRGSQLQSQTSRARHFIDFRIGIGCFLRARQVIKSKYQPGAYVTVALILKGRARDYFDLLNEQQTEIEAEFGEELIWFAEWDIEKHVALRKEDTDPNDENDWSHQHEWMATKLEKLNEVFRPRLERLT